MSSALSSVALRPESRSGLVLLQSTEASCRPIFARPGRDTKESQPGWCPLALPSQLGGCLGQRRSGGMKKGEPLNK